MKKPTHEQHKPQVFLITNLNRVRTVNGGVESEGINLVSPSNSSRRVSIARVVSQGRIIGWSDFELTIALFGISRNGLERDWSVGGSVSSGGSGGRARKSRCQGYWNLVISLFLFIEIDIGVWTKSHMSLHKTNAIAKDDK